MHQKRPSPGSSDTPVAAPSGSPTLVKEPPVRPLVKEPPCRVAKSPPVSSPPASFSSATPTRVYDVEPEHEEEDEAAKWVAEVEGPPSKAPPPQSPFYRVMPAPLEAEQLTGSTQLPPPSAAVSDGAAAEVTPFKAKPSINAAPKSLTPGVAAPTVPRSSVPEDTRDSPEPERVIDSQVEKTAGKAGLQARGSVATEAQQAAPPATATRSRYKAPPAELQQGGQGGSTDDKETPVENAWGDWKGPAAIQDAGKNRTQLPPAGRVKAPPCHGGAAAATAAAPIPARAECPPSRMKAPPVSAKKSPSCSSAP